ncbi:hypothetical protein [Enterovirga rhinocerotis]|uniref:Uncharacterized protein n=1 Tax=Enterovirga rhinocerotis TaxID=1339210 RepID=A0A4V3DYS0_9HYPH|nr:hypothetical protein [Enterovirga rhinocerotis]TDR93699.1 hypothetical protein EV668_0964 [Enterovirga rhinocerotis]
MSLLAGFRGSRKRSTEEADRRRALKARFVEHLALGEDDSLTLSEIVCHDPACPGIETVILLMRAGERPRAYKIAAAVADVTEEEIEAACRELAGEVAGSCPCAADTLPTW